MGRKQNKGLNKADDDRVPGHQALFFILVSTIISTGGKSRFFRNFLLSIQKREQPFLGRTEKREFDQLAEPRE